MKDSVTRGESAGFAQEMFRLLRPFLPMTVFATSAGIAAGLCTAWLLATINLALHATGSISTATVLTFIGLCVLTLAGNATAGIINSVTGQKIIANLRKEISARIVCAPLAELESYRTHRLLSTLNSDVDTVSVFTFSFPGYAVALAIAVGCIAYMITLSPTLFILAAAAIVLGILVNRFATIRWLRYYQGVRGAQDELQKQYRAITEGAKELRMNRERRALVYGEQLSGAADEIADLKSRAMRLFYAASSSASTLFFVAIGVILLMQHRFGIDPRVASGFVIVLLYIRGPMEQLINGLPAMSQASVSFQRIAELSSRFSSREPELLQTSEIEATPTVESIELANATYAFPATGKGVPFCLGPVDLKVARGETLFIVGENGCGKTTLIKLLLGLYPAQDGELRFNGAAISDLDLDTYRQSFSAVFADYHLFDDLVIRDQQLLGRAQRYLEYLEIADKVKIEDGRFSTIDLSTGQRKRLALVHAMLEQRPVMMFDEWAADQDPTFRRIFYTEFLPELKQQGKTLIIVSHDDRYFGIADRVIRLERGRVVQSVTGAAFAGKAQGDSGKDSGLSSFPSLIEASDASPGSRG